MRQTGVSQALPRERRARGWVDFGVDETWEPAPPRRRRILDAEIAVDHGARSRPARAMAAHPRAIAVVDEPSPVLVEFSEGAGYDAPRSSARPSVAVGTTTVARAARAPRVYFDPATRGSSYGGVPGRRTVTIRGRGAERDLAFPAPGSARRPAVRRHERPGFKPDRAGLWAVVLGLLLVLVAAASAHGAVPARHAPVSVTPAVVHVAPAHAAARAFR